MRGLLFIEPLFHQTVAGNKTMTRRSGGLELINENLNDGWEPTEWVIEKSTTGREWSGLEFMIPGYRSTVIQCFPRYKVGEVLYIKEPIYMQGKIPLKKPNGDFVYKYGNNATNLLDVVYGPVDGSRVGWSNKLFMPASAAREFIRIKSIKCERLLDISDEDCLKEGIEQIGEYTSLPIYKNYQPTKSVVQYWDDPKLSFISLYKFANKMKPAAEIPNIWVWAYEYEYLKGYKP